MKDMEIQVKTVGPGIGGAAVERDMERSDERIWDAGNRQREMLEFERKPRDKDGHLRGGVFRKRLDNVGGEVKKALAGRRTITPAQMYWFGVPPKPSSVSNGYERAHASANWAGSGPGSVRCWASRPLDGSCLPRCTPQGPRCSDARNVSIEDHNELPSVAALLLRLGGPLAAQLLGGGFGGELRAEVPPLDAEVSAEDLLKWAGVRVNEKRAGAEGRACSKGEQECAERVGQGCGEAGRLGGSVGGEAVQEKLE
ncbi:hypothetical protein FIBSPDRAFT_885974 [Athelia psychrophila]|uniref:Uncharacterized protein n=1 Tax=Athelia psychrophila TaxID=1759441 RepID=A0A166RAV3_9AGAM|nr:hypothetical protein FIBSPDRAFT_885974 [Fibularhizoctonia sp. CBS 109695]